MSNLDPSTPDVQSESGKIEEMSHSPDFVIQFWGVRGSIPAPGPETVRYGGNTSCVEMRVGGKRLIFDGGTGLRVLGKNLLKQMPVEAYLFLAIPIGTISRGFLSFCLPLLKETVSIFMERSRRMEPR